MQLKGLQCPPSSFCHMSHAWCRAQEVKVLRQKPEQVAEGDANKLYIRSLDFDAAGNFLVAGCDDKNKAVLLWDASTWQQLQAV